MALAYVGFVLMLGRISPSDYGRFAIASLVVAALSSIGDLGLGVALIRLPDLSRDLVRQCRMWTLITGAALMASGWVTSLVLSVFGDSRISALLALLSVRLLLDGFTYIPTDLAQRQLRFRFLVARDSAAACVGVIAGVATAYTTYAEWCLAVSALAQVLAASVANPWAMRGLRRLPKTGDTTVRMLLPFAKRITFQQIFKYLSQSVDSIAVAALLTSHALGQYRVAQRLGIESSAVLRVGVGSFLLPELAEGGIQTLNVTLKRAQRAVLAVAGPLAVLLGSTSRPLVEVVLGDQWSGAATLLTLMSIAAGLQTYMLTVGEMLKFTGRADLLLTWTVGLSVVSCAALAAGAVWKGSLGVAVAYLCTYAIALPVGLMIQRRICGLGIGELVWDTRGVLSALTVLALVVAAFQRVADLSRPELLFASWSFGAAAYVCALFVSDRGTLRYLFGRST